VRFLLGGEHLDVGGLVSGFGGNSTGNSLNRVTVSNNTGLDSQLGVEGPSLEEVESNSSLLLVGDSDRDVSEGKLVSDSDGVSSNNDETVEVSSDSDSSLGLLDTEVVNGSVLGVELSHLGNFDLVPVDPFVVVFSGSAELEDNSVNSSLSEFGDGSDHLLVSDDELGNDSLGASDHLGVLNLDGVDHLENLFDGVEVSLGELDKVESTSVGSNVSGTVRDEGKFSFTFKVSVVDSVLDGSLGEDDKCVVFELEDLSL
jgi:hypothetical protein